MTTATATRAFAAAMTSTDVQQAVEVLKNGGMVTLFDDTLELQLTAHMLYCQVRDTDADAHRCALEYEVMLENSRRALEKSPLHAALPPWLRRWAVIDSTGVCYRAS